MLPPHFYLRRRKVVKLGLVTRLPTYQTEWEMFDKRSDQTHL